MYNRRIKLIAIAVILIAAGVGMYHSITKGNSVEIRNSGIRIYLSTDKGTYGPGEIVTVTSWIENTIDIPIPYTMWNIGDPPFYVYLSSDALNWQLALEELDRPEIRLPALNFKVLGSGERIVRELTWDQKIQTPGGPVQAPPGIYRIRATVYLGRYSIDHPEPVTVELTIRVKGKTNYVSREQALTTAKQHPAVKHWLRENRENMIEQRYEGEFWTIWFLNQEVEDERLCIVIDAVSGRIIEIK